LFSCKQPLREFITGIPHVAQQQVREHFWSELSIYRNLGSTTDATDVDVNVYTVYPGQLYLHCSQFAVQYVYIVHNFHAIVSSLHQNCTRHEEGKVARISIRFGGVEVTIHLLKPETISRNIKHRRLPIFWANPLVVESTG